MSFLINPFTFAVAGGDFESIATVTVGSGGAADIEFTSIPGTYQHLQIRFLARSTRNDSSDDYFVIRVNNDTGSNYAMHYLIGNGSSASAAAYSSQPNGIDAYRIAGGTASASVFGAAVLDILDYASTSKTKVVRNFAGSDNNGSGMVTVNSGLWNSTSAITSIKLISSNDFVQHTTAALFGVKAP